VQDINNLKCEFGLAYVRAVASAAGLFTQEAARAFDSDGVDLTIMNRGSGGVTRSPRLDLQVKSTSIVQVEDQFSFDLPVKNYDELRDSTWQVPRILVVVVVPELIAEWITQSDRELIMRRCGYWRTLIGDPEKDNRGTVRISMQRQQRFDVDQLQSIMARINQGGLP
jgi:hypothetical protein